MLGFSKTVAEEVMTASCRNQFLLLKLAEIYQKKNIFFRFHNSLKNINLLLNVTCLSAVFNIMEGLTLIFLARKAENNLIAHNTKQNPERSSQKYSSMRKNLLKIQKKSRALAVQ